MSNIYCGNNRLDTKLTSGQYTIGTRYQCLKKGVGVGLNLPIDRNMLNEYEPIDMFKIYCGNIQILPQGYDKLGSPQECHRKGVGVGKKIRARRNY